MRSSLVRFWSLLSLRSRYFKQITLAVVLLSTIVQWAVYALLSRANPGFEESTDSLWEIFSSLTVIHYATLYFVDSIFMTMVSLLHEATLRREFTLCLFLRIYCIPLALLFVIGVVLSPRWNSFTSSLIYLLDYLKTVSYFCFILLLLPWKRRLVIFIIVITFIPIFIIPFVLYPEGSCIPSLALSPFPFSSDVILAPLFSEYCNLTWLLLPLNVLCFLLYTLLAYCLLTKATTLPHYFLSIHTHAENQRLIHSTHQKHCAVHTQV